MRVDDPRHDAVAELLVPDEIAALERRRDAVRLEVVRALAGDGLLPRLLARDPLLLGLRRARARGAGLPGETATRFAFEAADVSGFSPGAAPR